MSDSSIATVGGPGGPLGINARIASNGLLEPARGLSGRYWLQALARDLLPNERVATCRRAPLKALVEVVFGLVHRSAYYGGLETCSSVWCCPVCSSKITERRKDELAEGIARHEAEGGRVYLATYTIRHHKGERLREVLGGLLGAHRRLKGGGAYQVLKDRVGYIGSVRSLEVTSGVNGWHPHIHELWFVSGDIGEFEQLRALQAIGRRWAAMVKKEGVTVNKHGFGIEKGDGNHVLNQYITKSGSWDLAAEMTKASVKQSRGLAGRSVAVLLADYGLGDEGAGQLWKEYAANFKGRHHLQWSRGLRDRLGLGRESSDEELADERDDIGIILAALTRAQWATILGNDARADLLEAAKSGNPLEVWAFLARFGIVPDLAAQEAADISNLWG